MTLRQLSQNASRLTQIKCAREPTCSGISSLLLFFEGGSKLALGVDADTDEFVFDAHIEDLPYDLGLELPMVAKAYGLSLAWSWEMKNHQDYLDAVQLEFSNDAMSGFVILQFKVVASAIKVYSVEQCLPDASFSSRAGR